MWDIRYRPLKFADVLGQQGSVQVLKARLKNGTALDTSYLFSGGPGQGKTTLARILSRAVLCQQLNPNDPEPCNECDNCKGVLDETLGAFRELDAASRGTIEHVRKIVDDLPFAVFGAKKRVYVIDECHRMSKDAQDVLLKPLEEKKLVGMFCTTEPDKVRPAIRTRCEEYQIRKVTREDILTRMQMVLRTENVEFEDDGVLTLIDFCGGHVRDVLNKLEMVAQMGPVTLESVRAHLNLSVVEVYYQILLQMVMDTRSALQLVDQACERVTPEEVASGLAEAAMNSFRLANGMAADFTFVDKALGEKVYGLFGPQIVKVADYFARSRYATQVGLVCDLVTLAQSFGATGAAPSAPVRAAVAFQPIVQQVIAPSPPVASTTAPVTQTVESSAPATPPVVHAPPPIVAAPVSAPTPSVKHIPLPTGGGDVRPDGVGNLGSSDVCALTELDKDVIPSAKPKNNHEKKQLVFDANRSRGGTEPITSISWRKQFEDLWLKRGASSGS